MGVDHRRLQAAVTLLAAFAVPYGPDGPRPGGSGRLILQPAPGEKKSCLPLNELQAHNCAVDINSGPQGAVRYLLCRTHMSFEVFLSVAAILVSVLIYLAGVQRGARQERERQAREDQLERQRMDHSLTSKVANEYIGMVQRRYDSGVHALARLGLQRLGSDELIRQAIREMEVRTGKDPWGEKSALLQDIDLVAFFRLASERKVNFFETPIEQHIEAVRSWQASQNGA